MSRDTASEMAWNCGSLYHGKIPFDKVVELIHKFAKKEVEANAEAIVLSILEGIHSGHLYHSKITIGELIEIIRSKTNQLQ